MNFYSPGRPATPRTWAHPNDSLLVTSRSAATAGPLGSFVAPCRNRSEHLQSCCSRSIASTLRICKHHLAVAGHTERPHADSTVSCSTGLLGGASSKGNSKSPKRQFASDFGLEEQQKGYAESHSTTPSTQSSFSKWLLLGVAGCMDVEYSVSGPALGVRTLCCACRLENPPEAGILPDALVSALDDSVEEESRAERRATNAAASTSSSLDAAFASNGGILFHPTEQSQIKESWKHLMRWSRAWRTVEDSTGMLKDVEKVHAAAHASALISLLCLLSTL